MPEWLLGMMYVIMFACLFGNFVLGNTNEKNNYSRSRKYMGKKERARMASEGCKYVHLRRNRMVQVQARLW